MKINRMWALYHDDGVLASRLIAHTEMALVDKVEQRFGMKWPELAEHYGYTIEKVVVLRAEEFEELLGKRGNDG